MNKKITLTAICTLWLTYINTVFQPDNIVEMRIIKGQSIIQQWHYAKDLPKHLDEWRQLNERGYSIYIGVNPRKEFNASGDKNVKFAKFFFADFDSIELGDGSGI